MTKSTKSHQRERSPLFENSSRVHELVARAVRGECVRQQAKQKVGGFITLRNLSYTTRANMSHEKAKQIRARIVCTPAESARRAWGSLCADGMESAFLFCLLVILGFYLVGVGASTTRKIHKDTLFLSRFLVTKSAAKVSKEGLRRPPS